jgi:hypothetical protein
MGAATNSDAELTRLPPLSIARHLRRFSDQPGSKISRSHRTACWRRPLGGGRIRVVKHQLLILKSVAKNGRPIFVPLIG